jgi:hypothetical protein
MKNLNPIEVDASQRPECLPGTRQDILSALTEWLATPSDRGNVFWLHGVAGAGKSTISTTISQYFRNLGRLGAFIFFDRNNTAGRSPSAVVRTIAYWMAASNNYIRDAVCTAITSDATVITASLQTQFQKLLLEPLSAAQDHIRGPMVVILDAIDECGDSESRAALVSLIATEFPRLPAVFRFLVTSRLDSDIANRLRSQTRIAELQLDITTTATRHDIVVYLRHSMNAIRQQKRSLSRTWPEEATIQTLADRAGGLFIWASTACKFTNSFDPQKRLAILLSSDSNAASTGVDELYAVALRNSADWKDDAFSQPALAVLGAVILSRVPLTTPVLDALLGFAEGTASEVLEYLGCVVQWSPGHTARILHASCSDYLTDNRRSGKNPWFIDPAITCVRLALGCLRVLKNELRFNICGLEDSHLLNADVESLQDRFDTHVSPQLAYASQFWAAHLYDTDAEDEVVSEVGHLMRNKFLYWLEVLSLSRQVPAATESLEIARDSVLVSCTNTLPDVLFPDA